MAGVLAFCALLSFGKTQTLSLPSARALSQFVWCPGAAGLAPNPPAGTRLVIHTAPRTERCLRAAELLRDPLNTKARPGSRKATCCRATTYSELVSLLVSSRSLVAIVM